MKIIVVNDTTEHKKVKIGNMKVETPIPPGDGKVFSLKVEDGSLLCVTASQSEELNHLFFSALNQQDFQKIQDIMSGKNCSEVGVGHE